MRASGQGRGGGKARSLWCGLRNRSCIFGSQISRTKSDALQLRESWLSPHDKLRPCARPRPQNIHRHHQSANTSYSISGTTQKWRKKMAPIVMPHSKLNCPSPAVARLLPRSRSCGRVTRARGACMRSFMGGGGCRGCRRVASSRASTSSCSGLASRSRRRGSGTRRRSSSSATGPSLCFGPSRPRNASRCCVACVCVFISCACLLVYVLRGMRVAEGKECTPVEGFF